MIEAYLSCLELAYFEVGEAFKGLADENVWKRPAEGLLSVGELSGHCAYWEAVRMAGGGEDLSKCKVQSPLIDARFRYYSTTLETPPSPEHLAMSADEVLRELKRVHEESVAHFRASNRDLDGPAPSWGGSFREYLKYAVFHVSYHTGQMYSARHLLGEETPDN